MRSSSTIGFTFIAVSADFLLTRSLRPFVTADWRFPVSPTTVLLSESVNAELACYASTVNKKRRDRKKRSGA